MAAHIYMITIIYFMSLFSPALDNNGGIMPSHSPERFFHKHSTPLTSFVRGDSFCAKGASTALEHDVDENDDLYHALLDLVTHHCL